MKIFNSLKFPFRGPRSWANIGLLGVAQLIPVIGPILVLGYGCIVEKMLVREAEAPMPAFDFKHFSLYLERGIWPFLVRLVITLPIMFILFPVIWFVSFGFFFLTSKGPPHPALIIIFIVAMGALAFGVGFLFLVAQLPFILRASLLGKFGPSFDFRWALDFFKRVGGTAVIAMAFLQIAAIPLVFAGLLCCYFGIFFAAAIVQMMFWHLQVNLYHLYIDRGGKPLEVPDETMAPAFPVLQSPAPPPAQAG